MIIPYLEQSLTISSKKTRNPAWTHYLLLWLPQVSVLSEHNTSCMINEICVHPVDHWLIFTASKDESIRLWNLTNRVCIAIFAGEQGHRDEVLSMDIHLFFRTLQILVEYNIVTKDGVSVRAVNIDL